MINLLKLAKVLVQNLIGEAANNVASDFRKLVYLVIGLGVLLGVAIVGGCVALIV